MISNGALCLEHTAAPLRMGGGADMCVMRDTGLLKYTSTLSPAPPSGDQAKDRTGLDSLETEEKRGESLWSLSFRGKSLMRSPNLLQFRQYVVGLHCVVFVLKLKTEWQTGGIVFVVFVRSSSKQKRGTAHLYK